MPELKSFCGDHEQCFGSVTGSELDPGALKGAKMRGKTNPKDR
jgi:hypothetical protein